MKKNKFYRGMYLFLASIVGITSLAGCATQVDSKDSAVTVEKEVAKDIEVKGDNLTVIRYGTHHIGEEDPNAKNPVTGEYLMGEEARQIKLEALEVVKEELGVDFQFVQYPSDVTEALLQSVLAGDPLCDIARLPQGSQGTVLGQNILYPVDEYIDLLGENPPPKVYGKQYFINMRGNNVHPLSSLMYNINYIEEVPALKVDGKTVYPTDLYEKGEWTWSVFEDYLKKIDDYYSTSKAPERPEYRIEAYKTQYQEAALQAIHSAGGSIYDEEGLKVDSPETIKGVKFIEGLIDKDLLKTTLQEGTSTPVTGDDHVAAFKKGESVFTNFHDWRGKEVSSALAKRGESLGFVPFPRPDDMDFGDVNYRQVRTPGETYAILKGIDEDKVELAIKAYFLYEEAQDRIYLEKRGEPRINIILQMDRFHPEIGEALDRVYNESISKTFINEMGDVAGVMSTFYKIMGDALWGANGSPSYEVAIEANKGLLEDIITSTSNLLQSDDAKDNVGPKITSTATPYILPLGTDLTEESIRSNLKIEDNVDGEIDNSDATITFNTEFKEIGVYEEAITVSAKDSCDNETIKKFKVTIYDPNNTEHPILEPKAEEEFPVLPINKDVTTIKWRENFIQEMKDASGIPLEKVEADVSNLDTTTAGRYEVTLSVADYNGRITERVIYVTVK